MADAELAYADVMRINRPPCTCKPKPPMKLPRFCTNCGSWFDGATTVLHCKNRQQPPAWDALRQHFEHHHYWLILALRDRAFAQLPHDHDIWVYRTWDGADASLYIGMTTRGLSTRLFEHAVEKEWGALWWWPDVDRVDAARCATKEQALAEEERQIRAIRPLHNVQHNTGAAA